MHKKAIAIAAGIALGAAGLPAQTGVGLPRRVEGSGFQQFGTIGSAGDLSPSTMVRLQSRTREPLVVAGSPFSATEERKTVQTLGDGTQIEQADSNLIYRDAQGRTRVEQTWKGKTTIVIMDPVARWVAQLDPTALTAFRSAIPQQSNYGGISIQEGRVSMGFSPNGGGRGGRGTAVAGGGMDMSPSTAVQAYQDGYRAATASAGGGVGMGVGGGAGGGRSGGGRSATMTPAVKPLEEDLGTQNQNGVPAQGTRNTITIPAGQIGNNRDIHVVNERWYSSDLQMLVKSVNSDPRFGTTTYQLTNIIRSMPDAGLFQIPGSYTVNPENGWNRFAPAVGK
jgi:hypothetical protein